MVAMPKSSDEPAHDVLAAEEFAVPAPDPRLRQEDPHDVLAAEEFGVPAPDPALHHGPIALPGDPTGLVEAHDVLAAEEFALPAPPGGGGGSDRPAHRPQTARAALTATAALVLMALRRRARRR